MKNLRKVVFWDLLTANPKMAKYYQNYAKHQNTKSRICEDHANKELSTYRC